MNNLCLYQDLEKMQNELLLPANWKKDSPKNFVENCFCTNLFLSLPYTCNSRPQVQKAEMFSRSETQRSVLLEGALSFVTSVGSQPPDFVKNSCKIRFWISSCSATAPCLVIWQSKCFNFLWYVWCTENVIGNIYGKNPILANVPRIYEERFPWAVGENPAKVLRNWVGNKKSCTADKTFPEVCGLVKLRNIRFF